MKPPNDSEDALVRVLNELAELDDREVSSYQAAMHHLPDDDDRCGLVRLMDDHKRHAAYLKLLVLTLGGQLPTPTHPRLLLAKSRLALAGLVGEKAVLGLMKRDEDRVTRAYLIAMSRPLPKRAHHVMEKALREQLQHGAWIEGVLADVDGRKSCPPLTVERRERWSGTT